MATNDGSIGGGSGSGDGSTDGLSRVLTWVIIGVVALIAVRIAMLLFGLAAVVLWRFGPILLVGWLIVMAVRYLSRKPPSTDDV
jgi:hypothetical protein